MNRFLLIPLVFFCLAAGLSRAADDFAQASAAYDKADYARCAELLDHLHKNGQHSPESWLMAGNAHAMTGKKPEAILAFRRALLLDPKLSEASQNLGVLAGQAGVTEPPPPATRHAWLAAIPPQTLVLAVSLGVWLAVFGGLGMVMLKSAAWPTLSLASLVTGLTLGLGGGTLAWTRHLLATPNPYGTVKIWQADAQLVKATPLRATPARLGDPIIPEIPAGTALRVVQESGWTYVEVPRGGGSPPARGWIESNTWTPLWPYDRRLVRANLPEHAGSKTD